MAQEVFTLDCAVVCCGLGSMPAATVRIITPTGEELSDAAIGEGPVEAIYKAIDRIVGVPTRFIRFNIRSNNVGAEALGVVRIKIEVDGKTYTGRAENVDIIAASAKAYINALNKIRIVKK